MCWTKRELKKSYQCNGKRIRDLRLAKNWTQRKLAKLSGYSERLIGKAESGGSLTVATIRDLATTLSQPDALIHPEDLMESYIGYVKTFVDAMYDDGPDMLQRVRHFIDDNAVLIIPGDPEIPFAGNHVGLAGFERAIASFFSLMEAPPKKNDGTDRTYQFYQLENDVLVWGDSWIHPIGKPLDEPINVTMRFRFRLGKLSLLESRFDVDRTAAVLGIKSTGNLPVLKSAPVQKKTIELRNQPIDKLATVSTIV